MIIINAGIPRSGTVLVNAIIRRILEGQGEVESLNPPASPGDMLREVMERGHAGRSVVFHCHQWTAEDTQRIKALGAEAVSFCNYRDPRDCCVSLMRLHDHPLELSMANMRHYVRFHRQTLAATGGMAIRYEDLVADTPAHVSRIAGALGVELDAGRVAAICGATSQRAHARIAQAVAEGKGAGIKTIRNSRRTLREDSDTHLADRHIQSGRSGRWQQELSPEDQARLSEGLADDVRALGYRI
ncbi:hypothetical protein [Roseovarius sp. MMSF_3281]|uniref:hypothetical protein n=1 Tax=Roseovarius sp. MMSF_3281 TaxID=3046694 RepID=UPI00273D110D|nr:hypothetical protein [Roseovarius sp. MMSF_3281]